MRKNRYIPFGYAMRNGEIVLHEKESAAVKRIFRLYLNGTSLKDIAEDLEKHSPKYIECKVWNKHMVKRIIEDKRYVGEKGYPQMITHAEHTRANYLKADKNTSTPLPVPAEVEVLKSKTVCAECGRKYIRKCEQRRGERWMCNNLDCEAKYKTTDKYLLDTVMRLLNAVIENPSIVKGADGKGVEGMSLEIVRLQNEIDRELEKPKIDADTVHSLIFTCAAKRYAACADDRIPLEKELANMHPLTEPDADFINRNIKLVLIGKDGGIRLKMINDIILAL